MSFSLTKNVSEQWAQVTRCIPGIVGTGGVTGLGAKLMMRLQFGLGQAIRCDEFLQIRRQLHGHRTYFFPGGALRIGCKKGKSIVYINLIDQTVEVSSNAYCCFLTKVTFNHMLFTFAWYINHCLTHSTSDHRYTALRLLIWWWHFSRPNRWYSCLIVRAIFVWNIYKLKYFS